MSAIIGCNHEWIRTKLTSLSPLNPMLQTGVKYVLMCSKCGALK